MYKFISHFYKLIQTSNFFRESIPKKYTVAKNFGSWLLKNIDFRISRTNIVSYGEGTTIRNKIGNDADFNGVYCRSLIYTLYQIKMLPADERNISICKESLYTIPVVIYSRKNFYLLKEFNVILGRLIQAGLINFWRARDFDFSRLNRKENQPPKVLTLPQVQGCFKILVVGYLIGGVVFIIEQLFMKKRNLLCFLEFSRQLFTNNHVVQ